MCRFASFYEALSFSDLSMTWMMAEGVESGCWWNVTNRKK